MPEVITPTYDHAAIRESYATDAPVTIPRPASAPGDYFPYQKAGIDLATRRKNVLIADEMGLGKTVQALGTVNNTGSERVLIVSPKSLVSSTWAKDAGTWLADSPPVYEFTERRRWNVPDDGPAVVIMSYSQLKNYRDELRDSDFDMVVLDESHTIGNPKTQAAQEIIGCVKSACATGIKRDIDAGVDDAPGGKLPPIDAERKILLTGTPFRNRHEDLYTQVAYLDPAYWGNPFSPADRAKFNERYMSTNDEGRRVSVNNEDLGNRLRETVMVRRLKEDVMTDMPVKKRDIIVIDAAGTAAERHEQDLIKATQAGENTPAAEMSRLRQVNAIAKAPQVAEHVGDIAKEEPVVVFAYHQSMIDDMAERLRADGLRVGTYTGATSSDERKRLVNQFQAGELDVFIGSLGAAATGLTLTKSRRLVIADLDWRPADIMQAEDRVHRIGQTRDVQIDYLVLSPGIDGNMATVLGEKLDAMDRTLGVSRSAMFATPDMIASTEVEEGFDLGATATKTGYERQDKDYLQLRNDEAFWANRLARERVICDEYRSATMSDLGEEIAEQTARLESVQQKVGLDIGSLPTGTVALSLQDDGSLKALTVVGDDSPAVPDVGPLPATDREPDTDVDLEGNTPPEVSDIPTPGTYDGEGVLGDDTGDDFSREKSSTERKERDLAEPAGWESLSMAERRRVVAEVNEALQRLTVARAIQRKVHRGMDLREAVDQYCAVVDDAWRDLVGYPQIVKPVQAIGPGPRPDAIAYFPAGYDRDDLRREKGRGYHRVSGKRRLPTRKRPSAVKAGSRRHPFLRRSEQRG